MSGPPIDIDRIRKFISENGGASNCYIGITGNIHDRFKEHGLANNDGKPINKQISWYWGSASSENEARNIEKILLGEFPSLRGNTGGGDKPTYVYIYKIIPNITKE